MYRLGQKGINKKKRALLLLAATLLLIIAGGLLWFFLPNLLKSRSHISQSSAVITKVAEVSSPTKVFQADNLFTLRLPVAWTSTAGEKKPYNIYRWQSDTKSTNRELVEVYVDTIPQNFAVNRALAVSGQDDHMTLVGGVSDNCSEFTKDPTSSGQTGTRAKWQGVDFICDLANYERNVVGISSNDGINVVRMKGVKQGQHQFFITYTEHNINPDYTIFYSALESFHLN